MRAGDAGQACDVVQQAAEIARLTGSVQLRITLTGLHVQMAARWPDDPRVTDLADALR
ncbi:MAG: hypothetical protein ABSA53_20955 [Streptosporangiaceae bacterium]